MLFLNVIATSNYLVEMSLHYSTKIIIGQNRSDPFPQNNPLPFQRHFLWKVYDLSQ